MLRTIDEIRAELRERRALALADENRDSRLFLRILDELAEHIGKLQGLEIPKQI
jgi:hypothetical protein